MQHPKRIAALDVAMAHTSGVEAVQSACELAEHEEHCHKATLRGVPLQAEGWLSAHLAHKQSLKRKLHWSDVMYESVEQRTAAEHMRNDLQCVVSLLNMYVWNGTLS